MPATLYLISSWYLIAHVGRPALGVSVDELVANSRGSMSQAGKLGIMAWSELFCSVQEVAVKATECRIRTKGPQGSSLMISVPSNKVPLAVYGELQIF